MIGCTNTPGEVVGRPEGGGCWVSGCGTGGGGGGIGGTSGASTVIGACVLMPE